MTPGATVTIRNALSVDCTVTDAAGAFDSGRMAGGTSGAFAAPTTPGRYEFACAIHNFQRATLVVDADEPTLWYPLKSNPYPSTTGAPGPRLENGDVASVDVLVQHDPIDNIAFHDGTYRLIRQKQYRWEPGQNSTDRDALASLIAHPSYEDTFLGQGPRPHGHGTHGPYRLERVTTDSFERFDAATAAGGLRSWTTDHGPTPDPLRERVEDVYSLIENAPSCFRRALIDADRHDLGWILTRFHELVLVDRSAGSVILIVAYLD